MTPESNQVEMIDDAICKDIWQTKLKIQMMTNAQN